MFRRANATFLLEPHKHDHHEWQHSEHNAEMSSRKKVSVLHVRGTSTAV